MSEKKQISLVVDEAVLNQVDRYAQRLGISRQKMMHNLLESALDDTRLLDSLGVLAATNKLRSVIDRLRSGQQELPLK